MSKSMSACRMKMLRLWINRFRLQKLSNVPSLICWIIIIINYLLFISFIAVNFILHPLSVYPCVFLRSALFVRTPRAEFDYWSGFWPWFKSSSKAKFCPVFVCVIPMKALWRGFYFSSLFCWSFWQLLLLLTKKKEKVFAWPSAPAPMIRSSSRDDVESGPACGFGCVE